MIINGGPNADTLTGTFGADEINGFAANDLIDGLGGNDVLHGDLGDDRIVGYIDDTIFGGSGEDTVAYGFTGETGVRFDMIEVGANLDGVDQVLITFSTGNDTLRVGSPQFMFEEAFGGAGFDLFVADFSARDTASPIRVFAERTLFGVYEVTQSVADLPTRYDKFEDLRITGGAGNDYFDFEDWLILYDDYWQGGDDLVIAGGGGNDVMILPVSGGAFFGGDGNDDLTAVALSGGLDTLRGGAGNDTVRNIGAEDVAFGGVGFDTALVDLSGATAGVTVGRGAALADFEEIFGILTGFDDVLKIYWQSEARSSSGFGIDQGDAIFGGDGTDRLVLNFSRITELGFDSISLEFGTGLGVSLDHSTRLDFQEFEIVDVTGSSGNDTLMSNQSVISIRAGAGDDYIEAGEGVDLIYGGNGDDSVVGDSASPFGSADRVFGGFGNDTIDGQSGNDQISGDDGNDSLDGGDGNDRVSGGSGDDILEGGFSGDDQLSGAAGQDVIRGHEGADVLFGGNDNDTLVGGSGEDKLVGGSGDDSLDGEGVNGFSGAGDRLYGWTGNDTLNGEDGNDFVFGGDGNDVLTGGGAAFSGDDNDRLLGDAGHDGLTGGEGRDSLFGGEGDDTLRGGEGADLLSGGIGVDRFIFDQDFSLTLSRDRITGYEEGEVLSFTHNVLSASDIQQVQSASGLVLRWADGAVLLEGYSGAVTLAFGEDAPPLF